MKIRDPSLDNFHLMAINFGIEQNICIAPLKLRPNGSIQINYYYYYYYYYYSVNRNSVLKTVDTSLDGRLILWFTNRKLLTAILLSANKLLAHSVHIGRKRLV